jgi:hypothetical protein
MVLKDGVEVSFIWAQCESSSGHYIGHASILYTNASRQIIEPTAAATQPRPMPCFKLNLLLLMLNNIKDGA